MKSCKTCYGTKYTSYMGGIKDKCKACKGTGVGTNEKPIDTKLVETKKETDNKPATGEKELEHELGNELGNNQDTQDQSKKTDTKK